MMKDDFRHHLSPLQPTRMVLGHVLSVLQVWPLTRTLHHFNLAMMVPQMAVFFATPNSEIEAVVEHNSVSNRLCVVASPSSPSCQISFSHSLSEPQPVSSWTQCPAPAASSFLRSKKF